MSKPDPLIPSHHDRLFKRIFSNPVNAASELACVLPADVLELVDLSTLKQESSEFISPGLKAKPADLFFSVKMREMEMPDALMYILIEHASRLPRFWQLRILDYAVLFLKSFVAKNLDAKYLPVVLPVVVHNGKYRYTGELSFLSLYPKKLREKWSGTPGAFPPFVSFMDDLRQVSSESVLERPMEAEAKLALWFLQHGYNGQQLYEQLVQCKPVLEQLGEQGNWRDAMESLLSYSIDVPHGPGYEPLSHRIEEVVGSKGKESLMSIAEQLRSEGEARGKAEGLLQGEARGLLQGESRGKAQAVLDLLEAREVRLSASERERILLCRDMHQLKQWLVKSPSVGCSSELFH